MSNLSFKPTSTPKVMLSHALPLLSAIFLAAAPVLSGVLSLALALARFGPQRFASSARFGTKVLTLHCSRPPTAAAEFRR